MINIPIVDNDDSWDCTVRKYRKALLNCLIHLSPLNCLEIGTHTGQSSSVFSHFFSKYGIAGNLLTVDVAVWKHFVLPNVHRVFVYPHVINIVDYHGEIDVFYDDYKERLNSGEDTVMLNYEIIRKAKDEIPMEKFDFCFVDGDHTRTSFLKDLELCKSLVDEYGYILIDDIKDGNHEQMSVYHNELKPKNKFYEFEDWQSEVGMALIQCKDLVL